MLASLRTEGGNAQCTLMKLSDGVHMANYALVCLVNVAEERPMQLYGFRERVRMHVGCWLLSVAVWLPHMAYFLH